MCREGTQRTQGTHGTQNNPQSFALSAFFRGYLARGIGSGCSAIRPGGRTTGSDCRSISPSARSISPSVRTISRDCASIRPGGRTTGPDCQSISPDCRTISPSAQTTGPDCRTISPSARRISPDCRTIRPDCRTPGALVQEQAHGKWSFTPFWCFLPTRRQISPPPSPRPRASACFSMRILRKSGKVASVSFLPSSLPKNANNLSVPCPDGHLLTSSDILLSSPRVWHQISNLMMNIMMRGHSQIGWMSKIA